MRVLLDNECGAVAGGHESACEQAVTTTLVVGGAVAGAVLASPGGPAAAAGALVGAAVGSYVADATAHYICSSFEQSGGEDQGDFVDPEIQDWHDNQYSAWHANGQSYGWDAQSVYAPHDYVADGSSY